MNLGDAIQDLFNDVRDVAQIIAPIAAVIGFLGLGLMYMGSSWPLPCHLPFARECRPQLSIRSTRSGAAFASPKARRLAAPSSPSRDTSADSAA